MKRRILEIIYRSFSQWSEQESWACAKGCAACCSQNVTITALEGEQILNQILAEGKEKWLAQKIDQQASPHRPEQTINEYARICLDGGEPSQENPAGPSRHCPFLEDGSCSIYQVRPFSCRCFLSKEQCSPSRPALVDNKHLAASTAISQLIEHLGQFEYWGNMLDVLPAMLDISRYAPIREQLANPNLPDSSRLLTLKASPLPGFLLGPDDYEQVAPLLETIFQETIEGKTVEAILNGAA